VANNCLRNRQAEALLAAAENTSLHAYIVVSLLTGARTEELRALTWSYVDLDSDPPFIMVWRSVRAGGDTKTRKSRPDPETSAALR
jgi:integrase